MIPKDILNRKKQQYDSGEQLESVGTTIQNTPKKNKLIERLSKNEKVEELTNNGKSIIRERLSGDKIGKEEALQIFKEAMAEYAKNDKEGMKEMYKAVINDIMVANIEAVLESVMTSDDFVELITDNLMQKIR